MYKLSLPIQNKGFTEENKKDYVRLCKKSKIDRIFLTASLSEDKEKLRSNIQYLKDEGFEVGIWVGNTIGHGETLLNGADTGKTPKYHPLVNIDGKTLSGTNCPYDKNFQEYVSKSIAALTACGSDMLMLDDDYRISQHGSVPACACPLHLKRVSELCGEEIKLENVKDLVFSGKRNKYR